MVPDALELMVLDEFFADASRAKTIDDLNRAVIKAIRRLGYDRINISVLRDFGLPASLQQFALNCNYPTEWLRHYANQGYLAIDPVAANARHDADPFFWADLPNLHRRQIEFLAEARTFGLHNGVGIPFIGNPGLRGGIAVATSDPSMDHSKRLDLLAAIAAFYYLKFKLFAVSDHAGQLRLPPQEARVASMVLAGKTNRQISKSLGSSRHTINIHVRHIYERWGVNSRVGALLHAIRHGIFDPYSTNE